MNSLLPVDLGSRRLHKIHIGGVCASAEPAVVRTVLGSCIAVCLRDPRTGVGGMNHFMLPACSSGDAVSARYGVHAMELLINDCMHAGADRNHLEAKVFGGGHVLRMRETDGNVPQSNIKFALHFLEMENIPIVSRDLGGYAAREIYFFTDSGRTMLKRLLATGTDNAELEAVERAERAGLQRPKKSSPREDDTNVTLF
ncbi:MAG: chemoreceptor glutamine deamidase CheD [Janthinobacterium lividum]